MKISIIIPVFNERNTIEEVIKKVLNLPLEKEIIIVDDGSTDGTREILEQLKIKNENIKVLFHKKNLGKGAAIRTALEKVSGEIVCIQDADLEYNVDEIVKLVEGFKDSSIEAVFGSRFLKTNPVVYKKYYLGNKTITFFINLFYGGKLTDSYTCYKLVRSDIIKKLNLESKRFEIEAEISIKLLKNKIKILELPISYNPRKIEEGKKINFKDAIKAFLVMIKYKFI
ncbi:MAG: glycosyltransferase family 2 protein [Endomicrobiia bacterium]